MNLPYPYFIEVCEYCEDPEGFANIQLTEEEEEEKKNNIMHALKQLRND